MNYALHAFSREEDARDEAKCQRAVEALGPKPRASIAAMVDYGLNDAEIARYYGVSRAVVTRLRTVWAIAEPC